MPSELGSEEVDLNKVEKDRQFAPSFHVVKTWPALNLAGVGTHPHIVIFHE